MIQQILRAVVLVSAFVLSSSQYVEPDVRFAWKQMDYSWPSPQARKDAIESGLFVQENNLPLGLARWKNKLFITIPKWKNGVPSSLNYVDVDGPSDQVMKPYPSWEANLIPDNSTWLMFNETIVSVFRVWVDSCDRLWVMDTGLADILGNPSQITGPSLVIFDLNTDQLLHRYYFNLEDMKDDSFFANLVVDTMPNNCSEAYAYIPDLGAYGVVVYNLHDNESWRVTHHYFHFDPLAGEYKVGGVEFHWTDGVFALALSDPREDGYRTMFFHALSSTKEFCVSTEILRNYKSLNKDEAFHDYKLLGERGLNTQSSASYFDTLTGVLFYTQVNRDGVGCWNTAKPYAPETNPLIISNSSTLEFPNDIKIDDEGLLWILSDKMPKFIYKTLDKDDINYRIFSINTKDAIAGSACV